MNAIRLDFLQNPPLESDIIKRTLRDFNLNSIAVKTHEMAHFREILAKRFDTRYALPFSFTSSGFVELFAGFKAIYYAQGLHYEIKRAIEIIAPFIPTQSISLQRLSDEIERIDRELGGKNRDEILLILPHINEDIFSINAFPKPQNLTLALDISYSQRLSINAPSADIYVLNGATFGLINGYGLIASNKIHIPALYRNGVSEAFCAVLEKTIATDSSNAALLTELQNLLGDSVGVFAANFTPNTLPLRLKGINTRHLIEHLYLEDVFLQNAQECALGFIKPSSVLISLGFGNLVARELCAITFDKIPNTALVANKIANAYKMIRLMEF